MNWYPPIFRGLSAAASLKPAVPYESDAQSTGLPRPQCRGLIEAARHRDLGAPARLFRGLSAAASLKPAVS